jgi:hypothetical protein
VGDLVAVVMEGRQERVRRRVFEVFGEAAREGCYRVGCAVGLHRAVDVYSGGFLRLLGPGEARAMALTMLRAEHEDLSRRVAEIDRALDAAGE